MLSILLLILKIIGIILLSVLGLLLFLICLLLFVPVRYRVYLKKENEKSFFFKANISYLLHIVSIWISYDEAINIVTKIVGFKLKKRNKAEEVTDTKDDSKNINEITDTVNQHEEVSYNIDWNDEKHEIPISSNESQSIEAIPDNTNKELEDEAISDDSLEDDEKASFFNKISIFFEKIKSVFNKCVDIIKKGEIKAEAVANKVQSACDFVFDNRNQSAISKICYELGYILKRFIPKKSKGYVRFGMEDPATTGEILAILGMLAPFLPRGIKIEPVFDEVVTEFDIYLKGRFALITLIIALWRLWFNKDVKRLWKMYRGKSSK